MAARRRRWKGFRAKEAAKDLLNKVMEEKPLLPFLIPLAIFAWAVERWLVPFSNWVPLVAAVWATIEYGRFQRRLHVEELNKRWNQLILHTSPITALEPCAWLNKLLMEVWPNYMEPKLSRRLFSIVEKRLKYRKPKFIEKLELLEFSLGSCPPNLGDRGVHWITSNDKQVMRLGFDWDTNEMSILLLVKLAKPLLKTARIVINSIHIKGDLLLLPILDGQAILYSFESTPEIRVGVAFGNGSSQTIPATELPGVSSWLVKAFTETIAKLMVEPHRQCFPLPPVELRKRVIGGLVSVSVISAGLHPNNDHLERSASVNELSGSYGKKLFRTFVEVEVGDLTRRTNVSEGTNPTWDATFNMLLHGDSGVLRFNLYVCDSSNVRLNYLTSCEIKIKYVQDDSTIFWAVGHGSGVIAKRAESCGKQVEMIVPFEEPDLGELTVSMVLSDWQFADSSISSNKYENALAQPSSPVHQSRTGRKLKVTVLEGRDLFTKDKSTRCDPYVKIQYGKALYRTKTISRNQNPIWNQLFEFDEIEGDEYLKINCFSADIFRDESIGSARVSLEGIQDGSIREFWVPLEKVNSGELRIQIEAVIDEHYGSLKNSGIRYGSGWIELVLVEARDLVAADLRGTSDPFVRVQYGNVRKQTKVVFRTLNPQWNQTLEFQDNGSPLALHVKDHNNVLPSGSIGHCTVEYQRLPPNETVDKWIPLQGKKSGEIHVKVTRKFPELQKKPNKNEAISSFTEASKISAQVRNILNRLHTLVEDSDLEGISLALSEIENSEDAQENYMLQLEREKTLLLDKIHELGHEITRTSSVPVETPY